MDQLTLLFLILLSMAVALQFWLARRQMASVRQHRAEVPGAFSDRISLEDHQKAADYTLAKTRLGTIDIFYSALLLLGWTLGGGLEWLDQAWRAMGWSAIVTGILVIFSFSILSGLLHLPISLYQTFNIEQRFGFNRMSLALFFRDMLKETLLMMAIGAPLLALVLWLMQDTSSLWWLYVWAVWMAFILLMNWAFPSFIAPLFNKFSPLEDEGLRQRIETLLQRCGFTSNGIFIMDGSTRSSHGNAYFTGHGQNKRIVFYDTLLESLDADEVEAVLAHELGHFKHHHIRKRVISMALFSLAGLALLAWLIEQAAFYQTLGISTPSTYMALLLFMLASPLLAIYLQPLGSALSRKHEFEADSFAAQQSSADKLITALVKLYRDNASTLTPDTLYSAFHDSHPPAPVRIAHLNRQH